MHITINNPTFNFQLAQPAMANAFFASLLRADEPDTPTPAADAAVAERPQIGEYWQGQGGIFAGDFRGDDGTIYGLIVPPKEDIGRARWAPDGSLDLSDWDGMTNTTALRNDCPAAKLAAEFTRDGHADFYLPARRELQLAGANLQHLFGKDSWYWTSTPRAEYYTWAVDFEYGHTNLNYRLYEFRVRPFRRFIY